MIWVNLLPWREKQLKRVWRQEMLSFALALLLLGFMVSVLLQKFQYGYQHWQRTVGLWQNTLQQAESLVRQRGKAISEFELLQQQQRQLQAFSLQTRRWLFFIQNFAAEMPDTLWLIRMEKAQHRVTLTGFSPGLEEIDQFRHKLSQYPLFLSVSPGIIERQSDGHLLFTLHATVNSVVADD